MAPSGIPIPNPRVVSLFLLEEGEGSLQPSHKTLLLLSCKVPTSAHVMRPIPEPTPSFGYVASIKVLSAAASPLKSRLKARLYNSVAAFESTASIKGSATAAKAKSSPASLELCVLFVLYKYRRVP